MQNTVIQLEHIKKSFGSNAVLVDISIHLQKGENLVILGKSGSGKSVLIKCLVGLIPIDSGTINVLDNDILLLGIFNQSRIDIEVRLIAYISFEMMRDAR